MHKEANSEEMEGSGALGAYQQLGVFVKDTSQVVQQDPFGAMSKRVLSFVPGLAVGNWPKVLPKKSEVMMSMTGCTHITHTHREGLVSWRQLVSQGAFSSIIKKV